ncbi:nicotinate phosphoribosyltransferase [Sphaerisporangium album]|uniref:Nicotinate phosphoribosyltransferase n=1 Tax=Sphaerisporangium album TaxID=509200 RepID=A0A367FLD4_9ACTN|nr:nicotinate phosphoribosyltransferase [Sphaerisporangium album]RCG31071.1 nicotinate phosphoribosyltransferase [Sphaerisporangium album]
MGMSSALLTDHYELTMLQAALAGGAAHRRSVFEVFARHLPGGRRYGVVAGTGRVLDALAGFRFGDAELAYLRESRVVNDETLDFLASYRFSGDVHGYREGECYFPGSPIMVVEGTFAEAGLLETVILSILNHDSAIASAASRMVGAAGSRPIMEFGSRRTHEAAAVASARAAYLAGFSSTSNLMAGSVYGVPTAGTAAHAFTLLHDSEYDAFQAQIDSLGPDTTLLIDTYDVAKAVRTAVELAGPALGAVRIDSGDLAVAAHEVRQMLDSLGATDTRIVVTSDLDEYSIAALAAAPVDGYGVGTSVVTGSGVPTAAMVYKLVAREDADGVLQPVAKRSVGKPSRGGRKNAFRALEDGTAVVELITTSPDAPAPEGARPLLHALVRGGEIVGREPLDAARERHRASVAELPVPARQLSHGDPVIPTVFS